MKYKAVFADVDGTLIPPGADGKTQASPAVIDAVKKCQQLGIHFSLATARSLEWVEGLITSLNLSIPIILDNGARIYDCQKNKYLHTSNISSADIETVISQILPIHNEIYYVNSQGRMLFQENNQIDKTTMIKIMILHVTPDIADLIYRKLLTLKSISITKSISQDNPVKESIHVTSVNAKKEIAMEKIIRILGIAFNECIGIGDSYNDLQFIKKCGLAVAMRNSVSEILEIADFVAPSYEEDGVALVIKKFILNNKRG